MNRPLVFVFGSSLLSFFWACAPSAESVARSRAASEFNCPEKKVTMTELSPGTEVVEACGNRVVYSCVRSGRSGRVCIREEHGASSPAPVQVSGR